MKPLVRFAKPDFGKRRKRTVWLTDEDIAVLEVLHYDKFGGNRALTNGGQVMELEERFSELTGGQAVAVSSCYAALYLSLLIKGIKPGDVVVMPALTHVALPNAVEQLGAKCHFIDSHIESGNLDPDLIGIPPFMTKLISVTHFLGRAAYMMSTLDIAKKYGAEVLEDCALAIGSSHSGRHVGLIGSYGTFSFYPCKHITTGGEGGILLTRNPETAEQAKLLRSFGYGTNRDGGVSAVGGNFRMTEMQAAVGIQQLKRLPGFLERRIENMNELRKRLIDFDIIGGSYAISVFVPDGSDRDEVRQRMLTRRVETSVYYPKPVPKHPYYVQKYPGSWPVAERISARTITLSIGPHLTPELMGQQAQIFRECLNSTKPYVVVTNENSVYRGRGLHRPSSFPPAA